MQNDFDLEDVAKELVDNSIDIATDSMGELIQPSADEVKLAAKELTDYVDKIVEHANTNEAIYNKLRGDKNSDNANQILSFSKRMIEHREQYMQLMEKVFNFQNLANAFLGQRIAMTFVYVDKSGNVQLYTMDNTVEHISVKTASKSNGGNLAGGYKSSLRQLKDLQTLKNSNYVDKDSLDTTFKEVHRRYLISKEKLKLGGAAYILWKVGEWDGAYISSAGPLGEAYLNFFLNEYIFSNAVEPSVRDFMLNESYGAILADNASGFLQGDVSKNGIEYGVKMRGASAMSYMNIVQYARDIQEQADVKNFLLNLKKELESKSSKNLVKPLNGQLNREIQELLGPMINSTT